jgi:hypothetical protein
MDGLAFSITLWHSKRYFLHGINCCDEDTQIDNNDQSQLCLYNRSVAIGGYYPSMYLHLNRKSQIKIFPASLASQINKYKNTQRKILLCNANICFNPECLKGNIILYYARFFYIYICSWVCASCIKLNNFPTRCNCTQFIIFL